MMISTKYVAAGILGFMVILGWNVFLAQRDQQLFRSAHERACQQVRTFHPDCQVTP
jgi:hypothetical protein